MLDGCTWQDDLGNHIDLTIICPRSVQRLVERAVTRWSWKGLAVDHEEFWHLTAGGYLEPVRALIHNRTTGLTSAERGCLEAAVVGAAPTQAKLVDVDLATCSLCTWCREEDGTEWHRICRCPGSLPWRRQFGFDQEQSEIMASTSPDRETRLCVTRAIPPDLRSDAPKPLMELDSRWT
eukprot:5667396-Karenia_brevis.AAC.1